MHIGTVHPNAIYSLTVAPLTLLVSTLAVFAAPFFDPLFWLTPLAIIIPLGIVAILHPIIRQRSSEYMRGSICCARKA